LLFVSGLKILIIKELGLKNPSDLCTDFFQLKSKSERTWFNYGTGQNGELYKSYGVNLNNSFAVGFSQGLTNSYYVLYYSKNGFYFFNHKLW